MAFPTGWGRRCAVTVDKTYVDAALSDFPVLCSLANLPSEMFDADGSYPARADGGDIRFSSDDAGATPLAREVVSFTRDNNPANGAAQIWVKVPTVSTVANTTIYVWYNAPSETEPAADSTYGSEAVWSDYEAVYHCEESSGNLTDSSANGLTLTAAGTPDYGSTGKLGKGVGLVRADNEYFSAATAARTEVPLTISAWINFGGKFYSAATYACIDSGNTTSCFRLANATAENMIADVRVAGVTAYAATHALTANSVNQHWAAIFTSNTSRSIGFNGEIKDTATESRTPTGLSTTSVGRISGSGNTANAILDEVRIAKFAYTTEWLAAEYTSQNAPGTFASAGSPSSPAGGTILPFLMRYHHV